ncbi:hypothetical protein NSQ26_14055 [Bacillus sp. FSL W7-1360]
MKQREFSKGTMDLFLAVVETESGTEGYFIVQEHCGTDDGRFYVRRHNLDTSAGDRVDELDFDSYEAAEAHLHKIVKK